ncbi:MAG: iron uptake porin [Symploca sp. SIO2G7]|nr:iron uptake porin [Symploca sp. SIO2G7]
MLQIFYKSGLFSSTMLGAILLMGAEVMATETKSVTELTHQSQIAVSKSTDIVLEPLNADASELATVGRSQEQLPKSTVEELAIIPLSETVQQPEVSQPIPEPALVAQTPADGGETDILEQIKDYNRSGRNSFGQVTSVTDLLDVSPGDWAYEALRELVEDYKCIVGYPDRTFRGNRPTTRYEFAAGLRACLDRIQELINAGGVVTEEDLETLRTLIQQFDAELAVLGTRVDNLDARVAFLEDHQFSTTTKLEGQVIFGVASVITGDNADGNEIDEVPILANRVRLEFNTSFTGDDLLFTRLSAGNFPEFRDVTGTFEGEIGFAQPEGNDVGLEVLYYSFPIGDNTQGIIMATGGAADDFASTVNLLDGDGAEGSISAFGTRNPIYFPVGDAGAAITSQLGDIFELSLGYLAGDASNPEEGSGLFDGPYSALGQLVISPIEGLDIGLTYIHGYNQLDTGTGSNLSNFQDFVGGLTGRNLATSSNSYGVEVSWQLSRNIVIGGWAGYTHARTLSTAGGQVNRGALEIWNWAATLGFPDLGKEGNLLGFVVGMEPKVTDSNIILPGGIANEDDDTSLHIEAFYQYQITDNIAITPGVIWVTAPNHNDNNEDLVIGTIRATFSF